MMPCVLTIAGSDPSGGAGAQRDLETFKECGVKGLSVITNVTSQTKKVFKNVYSLPIKVVSSQLDLILEEYSLRVAKTGLLYKKSIVDLIYKKIKKSNIKLVVDPIMKATLEKPLIQNKALKSLKKLLSVSYLVTPNINEAIILSQMSIKNLDDMRSAAKMIFKMGVKNVVIKGGHLDGDPIDVFYNGDKFYDFLKERIEGRTFHGLGCRFSAALTAFIGKDIEVLRAIEKTEEYMKKEINSIVHEEKYGNL